MLGCLSFILRISKSYVHSWVFACHGDSFKDRLLLFVRPHSFHINPEAMKEGQCRREKIFNLVARYPKVMSQAAHRPSVETTAPHLLGYRYDFLPA